MENAALVTGARDPKGEGQCTAFAVTVSAATVGTQEGLQVGGCCLLPS